MKLIDNASDLYFRDESEIILGLGFPWESRIIKDLRSICQLSGPLDHQKGDIIELRHVPCELLDTR